MSETAPRVVGVMDRLPCEGCGVEFGVPEFVLKTCPDRVIGLCRGCRAEVVRRPRAGVVPGEAVCPICGKGRPVVMWFKWTAAAWRDPKGEPEILGACLECAGPALEESRRRKRRETRARTAKERRRKLREAGLTERPGRPVRVSAPVLGAVLESGGGAGMTIAEVVEAFQRDPAQEGYGVARRTVEKMIARAWREGLLRRSLADPLRGWMGFRYRLATGAELRAKWKEEEGAGEPEGQGGAEPEAGAERRGPNIAEHAKLSRVLRGLELVGREDAAEAAAGVDRFRIWGAMDSLGERVHIGEVDGLLAGGAGGRVEVVAPAGPGEPARYRLRGVVGEGSQASQDAPGGAEAGGGPEGAGEGAGG